MSTISYLAQKTNTSVEKTSFSVAFSLILLILYHLILDFFLKDNVLITFSPEQLLTFGHIRQFELLVCTIFIGSLIYTGKPFERMTYWLAGNYYNKYFIHNRSYKREISFFKYIKEPVAIDKNFTRMYKEITPLREKYLTLVSSLYLEFAFILSFLSVSFFFLKYMLFGTDLVRSMIGALIILILLFTGSFVFLIEIFNEYIDLKHTGLMVLNSYSAFFISDARDVQQVFDMTKRGEWTDLRRQLSRRVKFYRDNYFTGHFNIRNKPLQDLITLSSFHAFQQSVIDIANKWINFSYDQVTKTIVQRFTENKYLQHFRAFTDLAIFFLNIPLEIRDDKSNLNTYFNYVNRISHSFGSKTDFPEFFLALIKPLVNQPIQSLTEKDLEYIKIQKYVQSHIMSEMALKLEIVTFSDIKIKNEVLSTLEKIFVILTRQFQVHHLLSDQIQKSDDIIQEYYKIIEE